MIGAIRHRARECSVGGVPLIGGRSRYHRMLDELVGEPDPLSFVDVDQASVVQGSEDGANIALTGRAVST